MGEFERKALADLPRGGWDQVERESRGADRAPEARWFDPAKLLNGGWSYRDARGRATGVYLGRWEGKEYGVTDDRHVFTVAGARAGKGASLIVPNLLRYEGSVIALDPKGELAKLTAEHRRKKLKQRVVVLDPFGVTGDAEGFGWNPLDQIDLTTRDAVDDALAIAEAMIQVPSHGEPHWAEAAQVVVQALVLCAKVLEKEDDRNLCTVHDMLMLTYRGVEAEVERNPGLSHFHALCELMRGLAARVSNTNPDAGGVILGVPNTYQEMDSKEREGVFSQARTQTRFLKSPSLRAVLGKSSLRLADIKRQPTTMYLCLPARNMGSHAKWLRIVISMALQSFEDDYRPEIPVLVVLDEFPVLGHMPPIERAAAFMPGFGVKLWTVLQDLGQLQELYRQSWETFVGNAGVLTFFGNTDVKTQQYIMGRLGSRTMVVAQPSNPSHDARFQGAAPENMVLRDAPLMSGPEIERYFGRDEMRLLVLRAAERPLILQRVMHRLVNGRAEL